MAWQLWRDFSNDNPGGFTRRYAFFMILFFLHSFLRASIAYGQVHCEWSRTVTEDTLGRDTFMDMAIDSRGCIYVTGYSGSAWSWTTKCLAAKLNAEGNTIWKSVFCPAKINSDEDQVWRFVCILEKEWERIYKDFELDTTLDVCKNYDCFFSEPC